MMNKKKALTLLMGVMAAFSTSADAQVIVAGWDTWENGSSPFASVAAPGITASAVATSDGAAWHINDGRGASADGDWGSVSSNLPPSTLAGQGVTGENLELPNATEGGTIFFTIANDGETDIVLSSFNFDSYAFRPKAARTYELSVERGSDITSGVIYTSEEGEITSASGAWSNEAHDDIDHDLTELDDHTLAPGESVDFLLSFSGGAGDGSGGHDLWIDNVAVFSSEGANEPAVIADFSSDETVISSGETAILSWSVGTFDSLTIDNEIGDVLASTTDGKGSIEVMPTATTTYILTGETPDGSVTAEVTIVVDPPPNIASFSASAASLLAGETLTLSWSTSGADSVTIEPGIGDVEATGDLEIIFSADVTYTLTATNGNGNTTSEVTVTSKPIPPSLGESLVAHWRVGESPGEVNGDILVSGVSGDHNATFLDTPTWVVDELAPTGTTAAVEFDGENFADCDNYFGIAGAEDRAISFWVKGDDLQNAAATLVSWGTPATSTRWDIRIGGSLNLRTEVAGSGSEGSAQILDGEWHHVAIVFANDGTPNIGDIVFYVDGELDELSVVGNTEVNTGEATPVRFGDAFQFEGRGFTGQLDDIRIYDREISQEEVAEVMAGNGVGPSVPLIVTSFSHDGTKSIVTWNSAPGQSFGVDSGTDLEEWFEISDGVTASDGATTTYEDTNPTEGATYYRIRLEQ